MRVVFTVADRESARSLDLVMDADPSIPITDVARTLATRVRGTLVDPGAGVVSLSARRAANAPTPELYIAGRPLDGETPLSDSPLVDGVVVGLDDPRLSVLPEPAGTIDLRVVAGPQAGTVHRLGPGQVTIGSDPGCALVLDSGDVPAVAATVLVNLDGSVEIRPVGPDAVRLDHEAVPVDGATWLPGAEVLIGASLLEIHPPPAQDADLVRSADGAWLDYNRPPRLLPAARRNTFRLPQPPAEVGRGGLPALGALAPALFGVVMALVLHSYLYLLMAGMTPMMLLGNSVSARRQGKKTRRQQMVEYRTLSKAIEDDVAEALVAERRARRGAGADPAELLLTATGPRARLWERRRTDPDHLLIRFGTADLPSDVVVEDPEQLEHRRQVQRVARDVPVSVSLVEAGVIGIAGVGDLPRRLASWAIGQLAVLQSPRDAQFYLLTEPAARTDWSWAAWLPHLRPSGGQDVFALIGADNDTLGRRVAELNQLVSERHKQRVAQGAAAQFADADVVVVLDGARRLRALPGVVTLLRDGPAVGVRAICLDADERLLPEECAAVVTGDAASLTVRRQREDDVAGVRPDLVPPAWFERVGRALAPVRDVSDSGDDGALPASARLLDVIGLEPPTAGAVAARWLVSPASTAAVVGASLDGPFAIDLRRDGPHGLVAGTTGSGKSELLQTIVASLAVANRPDEMTFVLVDYKGGAAFKDCVALPHTVGMVTDLDTHLVERALTSLGAELTRREHILAAAGAKDIEDYADYRTRNGLLQPLPRLLIVIDEFASMARELPDFVTGLVNIAQRGRSLGIHLILATQRPTGVVSPEIRANTNLRIALRVTDPAESSDVIDVPDAARIAKSTPGRAYVRLGHASLMPFQSGRVGGRRPGAVADAPAREPWFAPLDWSGFGRALPEPPRQEAVEESEATDLSVLVDAIGGANSELGIGRQHSPWLEALPAALTVEELSSLTGATADGPAGGARIAAAPWAVEDLPAEQARRLAAIDLQTFGHLFIAGAPRSGRSQALRTIAGQLARNSSAADVHLFGIDCGNGALLPLTKLPHCGAVVQRTQTERATRLINRLAAELTRRQEVLGAGGFADITEQRDAAGPDDRLPHLVVLLDRWEGFLGTLGDLDGGSLTDQLWAVLREGASVGVHLIMTGDRQLLTGRVSTLTEDKLLLRLTDRGDYSLAALNPRKLPDDVGQGRGFRSESGIETQIALLDADPSGPAQAAALGRIAAETSERDRAVPRSRRAFRVDVLPSQLPFEQAWDMRDPAEAGRLWAMIGVGGDELLAVGPDLAAGAATFVVAGPPKSGRSSVLMSMIESLLRSGTEVVLAAPRPSPLRDLAGRDGVRAVLTGDDLTEEDLAPLLTGGEAPVVLFVDDAELLKDISAKDWLRQFMRGAGDTGRGVVIAGNAADVCSGFSGWQIDLKKNRNGALLSPQDLMDGDLVGVRVPRSSIGGPIVPGRALVHLGNGELVTVQVPLVSVPVGS